MKNFRFRKYVSIFFAKNQKNNLIFAAAKSNAKIAQLVEHDLAKVGVAGSSPVFRSKVCKDARMVEW